MTDLFIPYTQALALKELGFDEPCWAWWHIEDCDTRFCYSEQRSPIINSRETEVVGLPTYSQAFKWFREKYDLSFYIFQCYHKGVVMDYHPVIHLKGEEEPINDTLLDEHPTYEEAELACIIKLIEIVKTLKIED